jgi:predicted transcriptional regulator
MARMTVELPDQINGVLENLAERSGTSKTEILRRAIGTYKVLQDERSQGYEIQLIRNGEVTRVILPE